MANILIVFCCLFVALAVHGKTLSKQRRMAVEIKGSICATNNGRQRTFANATEILQEYQKTKLVWLYEHKGACKKIGKKCSSRGPVCAISSNRELKTFKNRCALRNAQKKSTSEDWKFVSNGECLRQSVGNDFMKALGLRNDNSMANAAFVKRITRDDAQNNDSREEGSGQSAEEEAKKQSKALEKFIKLLAKALAKGSYSKDKYYNASYSSSSCCNAVTSYCCPVYAKNEYPAEISSVSNQQNAVTLYNGDFHNSTVDHEHHHKNINYGDFKFPCSRSNGGCLQQQIAAYPYVYTGGLPIKDTIATATKYQPTIQ